MCFSVFLAQVIGFYTVLVSLAFLIHRDHYKKTISDFLGSRPLMAVCGSLSLIFGLIIVIAHNKWVGDWRLLITLIGWYAVLQGLARLFFPEQFAKVVKDISNGIGYLISFAVWMLIGLYLIWMGVM